MEEGKTSAHHDHGWSTSGGKRRGPVSKHHSIVPTPFPQSLLKYFYFSDLPCVFWEPLVQVKCTVSLYNCLCTGLQPGTLVPLTAIFCRLLVEYGIQLAAVQSSSPASHTWPSYWTWVAGSTLSLLLCSAVSVVSVLQS